MKAERRKCEGSLVKAGQRVIAKVIVPVVKCKILLYAIT